jgi:hypothetical protein
MRRRRRLHSPQLPAALPPFNFKLPQTRVASTGMRRRDRGVL